MNLEFKATRNLTGLIGGGIQTYVREDIPNTQGIKKIRNIPEYIESAFIEINLIKTEWLFCDFHHQPSQSEQYFFEYIGNALKFKIF